MQILQWTADDYQLTSPTMISGALTIYSVSQVVISLIIFLVFRILDTKNSERKH